MNVPHEMTGLDDHINTSQLLITKPTGKIKGWFSVLLYKKKVEGTITH